MLRAHDKLINVLDLCINAQIALSRKIASNSYMHTHFSKNFRYFDNKVPLNTKKIIFNLNDTHEIR